MSTTPGTSSPSVQAANPASGTASGAPAASATWKVFAGNLSFKTREDELKKAFSAAGNVISANIITRGPRSLGYGFVEFATEAEAKKSVQLLNKKELDGRDINVEVAKTRDESAPAAPRPDRSNNSNANTNTNNNNNNNNNNNGSTGGPRRGGRGAGRGYLRRRPDGNAPSGVGAPQFNSRPRGGDRPFRGSSRPATGGSPAANNGAARPPRVENENRAPRTPSANTLFVANLPFSVTDKELQEIFQGFAVLSAHVVVKRNGRSKGFGFVEFKTQDDQTKALNATDKKQVGGRELIVKVALTEQVNEAKAAEAAEKKDAPVENKTASPATPAADKK